MAPAAVDAIAPKTTTSSGLSAPPGLSAPSDASSLPPTSLLAALNCRGNIHLIVGSNPLAASRCAQSLAAGAWPILVAPEPEPGAEPLHHALQRSIDAGDVNWQRKAFEDADLLRLGRDEVGNVVDAVFVASGPREPLSAHISALCRRNRIPVNVVDAPDLCTFSLLSVHADGPLQVGVTTNGRGCKLSSRIRREIAAVLPPGLGPACDRLGEVRRRLQREDGTQDPGDLDDSLGQGARFNRLVTAADAQDVRQRRMRWLSQVCEYWPLKTLASITDADVDDMLAAYARSNSSLDSNSGSAQKKEGIASRTGRIILAGSGPGHPDLLTQATHKAILAADLVLADKLVPAGVLDLVPRRTPVRIARKFPGNAEQAQEEQLEAALDGVRAGKTVLRLKQGDPFVYGRGGEEVAFFREHGLAEAVTVLPGVTSALSAPLFAAIPPTQRGVADQILVCTGTGRKGKPPPPPEYVPTRTVVFLMALHRIVGLVRELTTPIELDASAEGDTDAVAPPPTTTAAGEVRRALWPRDIPCAVIERASCPDQRVIRTTLEHVAEAIETEGSRPPGLLVVGRACEALYVPEAGRAWTVEEGFGGLGVDGLGGSELEKMRDTLV